MNLSTMHQHMEIKRDTVGIMMIMTTSIYIIWKL